MIEFFTSESKLVKDQVYLINNGHIKREDVLPLYNLREVVYYELDKVAESAFKDDSMVIKNDTNAMEGGN